MSDPFFVHSEYQAEFYGGLIREIDESREVERDGRERSGHDHPPSFLVEYWRRLASLFSDTAPDDKRPN